MTTTVVRAPYYIYIYLDILKYCKKISSLFVLYTVPSFLPLSLLHFKEISRFFRFIKMLKSSQLIFVVALGRQKLQIIL